MVPSLCASTADSTKMEQNMHRHLYLAAIPVAFVAGLMVSQLSTPARAQAPEGKLTAQIIDLSAMTDADVGAQVPNMGTLRSKSLVVTSNGTVAVQTGNVPKHTHMGSDEIQYVISGSGTFWLGNEQRPIHPGDLIIIPRGTVHAGSEPTSGEFKVLSIKLPPQAPGDMQMVP
jgi:quercetin dioxygenase-like cupin family protein